MIIDKSLVTSQHYYEADDRKKTMTKNRTARKVFGADAVLVRVHGTKQVCTAERHQLQECREVVRPLQQFLEAGPAGILGEQWWRGPLSREIDDSWVN